MNDFNPEVILSSNLSRSEDVLDNEAGNDNDPNSSVFQSEMKNPTVSGSTPVEQHQDERLLVVPLPKTADSSSTCCAYNITEDAAGIELTANLHHQAGKPHEDCSKGRYLPAPQPPTATIDRFRRHHQQHHHQQHHQEQQQQKYHYGGAGIISDPTPSHYGINNHLLHHGHHGDVTNEIFIINDEAYYGAPQQTKEQSGVLPPNQPHAGLILIQPPVLQQQQGTGIFFLVTGQGNGTEGSDLNFKSSTIGAHDRTSYTNNHVLRGGGSCLPQSQNLHQTEQLYLHNPSVIAQLLAAERNRLETIQMGMRINQQDVFQAQHYLSQPPRLHHDHRPRVLLEQGNTVDGGTQYSNFISERRAGFIPDRDIIQPTSDIIIGKNAATEGNVAAYINEPHLQDRAGSANILKINGVESASAFVHGHPVDISKSRLPNSRTLLPTGNSVSDDAFPLQINSIPRHQHTTSSSTLLTRGSQYSLNNDERECQEERKFQPNFSASQFTTNGANKPLQESSSDQKEQPKKKKKQHKKRKLGAQKKLAFAEKRPRRPLTAYNFFFSEERERVLIGLPTINNSTTGEGHEFESSNAKELHAQGVGATTAKETVNGAMELSDQGEGRNIDKAGITSLQCNNLNDADLKELEAKISANTQRILKTHKHMEKPKKAHRKIHGKINFQSLAKTIGGRWRALSDERKQYYKDLASKDKLRYCEGMKKFNKIENRINYND